MIAIRGATTVSKNNAEEIKAAAIELFGEILNANKLVKESIISIFFSCTKDIDADYPGKYVREHFDLNNTAIMHYNEMHVENTLTFCIRILVFAEMQGNETVQYVYLKKASELRKDLLSN